jgi:iron complex outermembrane receptor protein
MMETSDWRKSSRVKIRPLLCFAVALSILFVKYAFAEDNKEKQEAYKLESITVTAQKRTQDSRDVSESIRVFNDVEIEDAGITGMDGLSEHVPNLEFYNFGSRRHSLTFMRGIKSLHGGEPATGYYVDGVNYSKSYMFDFPLFDVERIEVLKGPQGTLYGRNTMAGVINVHTKRPDNETCSSLGTTLGSENLKEVKGYIRTPLIRDKLFIGFAGLFSDRDGYMDNDTPAPGDDGRYSEGKAGRVKLRFLPTDKWDITLSLDGQQYDEGAFPFRRTSRNAFVQKGMFSEDKEYHYSHDFEGSADNDFWGVSLNASYDMPLARLTSITGYRDYNDKEDIDPDFSPLDMMRMHFVLEEQTFSQELRLASPEGHDCLEWLIGLYYFQLDNERGTTSIYRSKMAGNPNNPFGTGTGSRLLDAVGDNEGAALFGQATYEVREKLDIIFGLRYEYEEAEMDLATIDTPDGGAATTTASDTMDNDFNALLPKISLAYHPIPEQMLYATFSGAHRSGGFNTSATGGEPYDEEYSWVYEIGSKSSFLNNRLTLNLSGFYTDIKDEQVTLFDPTENQSYVENAGESHRLGFEAEAKYALFRGLDLITGFTCLEAKYDKYVDPASGVDYKDNTVLGVPDYAYNIAVQYRRPLWDRWAFFGRADLSGIGTRYFDDANTVKDDPYELVNLKLGVEGEHLDCYLWAKNLLDRHYVLFENVKKGIAEDGEPMTIGVSLNYRF